MNQKLEFVEPKLVPDEDLEPLAETVTVHANPEYATGIRITGINSKNQTIYIVVTADHHDPQKVYVFFTAGEQDVDER